MRSLQDENVQGCFSEMTSNFLLDCRISENIPPFFISLRKAEVIMNFKFNSVIAFPSTFSGNGQNSLPIQLKFGNLLLDPPR